MVRLHPHARERMQERGATEEEMQATVAQGEQFPAKFGARAFDATFSLTRNGVDGITCTRQAEAYAVQEGADWLVITVITRYF